MDDSNPAVAVTSTIRKYIKLIDGQSGFYIDLFFVLFDVNSYLKKME